MREERQSMSATRRVLLGGSVAVAAATVAPAVAASTASGSRSEWERAVAAYRAAEADYSAACALCDQAEVAASEKSPPLPEELLYRWHMLGGSEHFTERLTTMEAIDRWIPEGLRHVMGARRDRTLAAFAEYKAVRDAVEEAAGLPQAARAVDDASQRECDAYAAVRDTPAPDRRALIEKLELITERGDFEAGAFAVQCDLLAMEG